MVDVVVIRKIKRVSELRVSFEFPDSNIIVVTGKNGIGKTTLVKAFKAIVNPKVFENSTVHKAICEGSEIKFDLDGFSPFSYTYQSKLGVIDTKDLLPEEGAILAELPIPDGQRFQHFSAVAAQNSEISVRNAAQDYERAEELIKFLHEVYGKDKFDDLKMINIGKKNYYFIPKDDGTYIREDHLSSGEYFLIQIFRLVTSKAKLIIVDELDVALDAAAQVKLFRALKSLLQQHDSRLIVISHSLAFMNTVDDGGLYYLESNNDQVSLEQRSFGYIKADLYGFRGFDRYILTEDPILEGFIEFIIRHFSIIPYYQHKTIGVGGANQLRMIVEKNDSDKIFSDSKNVLAVVDRDVFSEVCKGYSGESKILYSPVQDLELFIYENRDKLFPEVELPSYKESSQAKKASKSYWKYLTVDKGVNINKLYLLIVEHNEIETQQLVNEIELFLSLDGA
ncbi:AAA family ATPase [Endozoicomonas sp. 4G]|uniref:AAA family ATPase n=1 Tax=Endozoicomonas sp. 4G TaxID=2872754 RepID=UPI0020791DFE|nr:AAA family ATPase [Endozoicomonas sp. 4G]